MMGPRDSRAIGIRSTPSIDNTYALPGGAYGAIESLPLDLRGYSIDDLPTLYFNYYLETQNQNSPFNDSDVGCKMRFASTPLVKMASGSC